jgi:hypothetical protein
MEESRRDKHAHASRGSSKGSRSSREHENLLLAKARLMKDIETTENPRYRQLLETSLAALEKQISETE